MDTVRGLWLWRIPNYLLRLFLFAVVDFLGMRQCYVNTNSSFIGNVNPFRYRGYYYDTETGFYYMQTRYYDPTICRFINADNYELVATLSSVPGELNI